MLFDNNLHNLVVLGLVVYYVINYICTKVEHLNVNVHDFMWGVPSPYPMVQPTNKLKWCNVNCPVYDPYCVERMGNGKYRGPPVIPPPNNSIIFS